MSKPKEEFLKILGTNIKNKRKELGLTQEALADKCGYTANNKRSTISKIEKGVNDVSASKLREIAKSLDVPVSELTKGAEHIQQKMLVCDLLEQCYSSNAYELIELFSKLDTIDQGKVLGTINTLLDAEKYSVKKESSNERAIS